LGVTQQAISVRLSHGNDSKTRKLSVLWTETERRWKAIFHLRTADSKTTEKRFFASDWRWEVDVLRQPQEEKNTTLSPVNRCHRSQHQHHGRTFMIRRWCSVSGGKRVLFTMSCWNWRFHYGDRYRLQLICLSRALRGKRPEYEQRHDKVILFHDNARPHVAKVVKKYLETLKWDVLPHPPYSPNIAPSDSGCSEGCSKSPVHFFRRNRKLTPKLDRLERRVIFSRWNSKIAWEMRKSSRQRWTILFIVLK